MRKQPLHHTKVYAIAHQRGREMVSQAMEAEIGRKLCPTPYALPGVSNALSCRSVCVREDILRKSVHFGKEANSFIAYRNGQGLPAFLFRGWTQTEVRGKTGSLPGYLVFLAVS
jgi:hypothetical protein